MSVSSKESKSVLELIPYFQEVWTIIDVGSNKGIWSDILIDYRDSSTEAGKYKVHFLEPNEMLLNYTRIKYDYNKNIIYNNLAAFSANGQSDFFYFTNENNGLSSLYHNEKWDHLPMQQCKVKTVTLDSYANYIEEGKIDIIKIDVEGAELDVLLGCKNILKEKRVKFIQIEYSEHYRLNDYTFKDVIDFVSQFGYSAFEYDGEYYQKINRDDFVDDYRLENFILTYEDIGRYNYTQLWNNEFKKNTKGLEKVDLAIELGSFEGLTSNYICDNLLKENGRLICVDPLEDYYLTEADEQTNKMFVGQHQRFLKNTKGQPIELIRKKSGDAWEELQQYCPDFIYVDGDHTEVGAYRDGRNSFRILRIGGNILFDDYLWHETTKAGIDKFLNEYKGRLEIIIKDYQVLVKKLAH